MTAARKRFEHFRDNVLPLRQRIVQQSQLHYNAMLLGVFELLEAKQKEIDAGRVKPTHMYAVMTQRPPLAPPRFPRHWSPEFCVRRP